MILHSLILEVLVVLVMSVVLTLVWRAGRRERLARDRGWPLIVGGFALLWLGAAVDVTDHFSLLSRFVVLGKTPYQSLFEKIVGSLGGFSLLALGFGRWLPDIVERRRAEEELRKAYEILESEATSSSNELELKALALDKEIAQRRRTDDALRQNVADLEKTQEQLRLAKEEAERANRAKSRFLASMSHEIRTPLHGIVGLSELLAGGRLDAGSREYAKSIVTSADALLKLVGNILDFSKIEAGKLELEEVDFSLTDVLKKVSDIMEPSVRAKGIELRAEVSEELPRFVRGDPGCLLQVFVNLVGNAVKFTSDGEVRLRVERHESGEGLWLRCSVRDTGIGIPPEKLRRLFVPFAQAETSTKSEFGGTGLGLSISRGMVELMGGSIEVESEPGSGSTFSFTVRLAAAADPPPGPAERAADSGTARRELGSERRLLLVEDNAVNRLVAIRQLEDLGYRVDVAVNGREALAALSARTYDLVLMDCRMPDLDGYETTRLLRQREPRDRRTPVIAVTASARTEERDKCLAAGMDDFLSKPYRKEALELVLDKWL